MTAGSESILVIRGRFWSVSGHSRCYWMAISAYRALGLPGSVDTGVSGRCERNCELHSIQLYVSRSRTPGTSLVSGESCSCSLTLFAFFGLLAVLQSRARCAGWLAHGHTHTRSALRFLSASRLIVIRKRKPNLGPCVAHTPVTTPRSTPRPLLVLNAQVNPNVASTRATSDHVPTHRRMR